MDKARLIALAEKCGVEKLHGMGLTDEWFEFSVEQLEAFAAAIRAESAAPGVVPEGWQLVPKKPTPAMNWKGKNQVWFEGADGESFNLNTDEAAEVYIAMLAAAPNPPGGQA